MLLIFRQLLFFSIVGPLTVLFTLVGILITPFFSLKYRYLFMTQWSTIFIFLAKHMCGVKYRVHGIENIPKKPCVIMCNHQSLWETVFIQTILPKPQSWILKKELVLVPFFGWGLWILNPIAIDRKNFRSLSQVVAQGKDRLAKGSWVVIYPEGTRVAHNKRKKFAKSGANLAIEANVPIVPVAHNAGTVWPKGLWISKTGIIDVYICEEINTKGEKVDELTKKVQSIIYDKLDLLSNNK